jgi:predicted TPR repeat methyltransferase
MCGDLDYQAPARLHAAVSAALGGGRRPGLDILDLGCGTGLAGRLLRGMARRLVGVDLSPEMVERARRRRLYDELQVAEITAWLGGDAGGRFDVIAACDALIYFGDLGQVVVPAARRLTPGGLVAFTVERSATGPFRLTDSGRYAHHREHLAGVASDAGLSVARLDEVVLRTEYGEPVVGLVAVFRAEG